MIREFIHLRGRKASPEIGRKLFFSVRATHLVPPGTLTRQSCGACRARSRLGWTVPSGMCSASRRSSAKPPIQACTFSSRSFLSRQSAAPAASQPLMAVAATAPAVFPIWSTEQALLSRKISPATARNPGRHPERFAGQFARNIILGDNG